MFNEQLAVLLLVMANQVSDHPGIPNNQIARMPAGGVERAVLQLKVDPKLSKQATGKSHHIVQRRKAETGTLFASNY